MFFACFYGGFVPTVMSIVLIYGGFVPTVMSIFFLWRPRADCLLGADCLATLSRTTTDGFHLAMYFKPSNTRRPLPWPSCAPFFLPKKALYAGQSLQCKDRMAGLLRKNDETNPSPWRFHLLACGTREARIASCIFLVASTSLPPTKSMCSDVRPEASELSTPKKSQRSLRT